MLATVRTFAAAATQATAFSCVFGQKAYLKKNYCISADEVSCLWRQDSNETGRTACVTCSIMVYCVS